MPGYAACSSRHHPRFGRSGRVEAGLTRLGSGGRGSAPRESPDLTEYSIVKIGSLMLREFCRLIME
jgi:hypothetical protein